jgi:hypothetical protein
MSYLTWSLHGPSRNTIVPSLVISILCLLGYVSSTSSASTMPEHCFAFFGYINTLPLGLLWATLPLGLLCLLGYFASWATLPLGLCAIDIVCFDNAGILLCLLGCAIIGHLLVRQMISYVNMPNRDTL